ncbi:MAG: hypothetical protein NZ811_05305 [Gammaproteobacteria bacterium]|nr:hypothetical protein [Gammaproteobacteria bacterium]
MKVSTIQNAIDQISADLDYLCSLVESPHPDFPVADAVAYSMAIISLTNQLDLAEDLSENELSEDKKYVKLSEPELQALNSHTEDAELALVRLEEVCGISLQKN